MARCRNSIVARTTYSFRGEVHRLETKLDLDRLDIDPAQRGAVHGLIARDHALDTYSYEYEVMEMAEIAFSAPQGDAKLFHSGSHFDLAGYLASRENGIDRDRLQSIATEYLGEKNLNESPDLSAALKAAYLLGRQDGLKSKHE